MHIRPFIALCGALTLLPLTLGHSVSAIIASNANLSTLNTIVNQFPDLLNNLSTASGTFFAPSNDALNEFIGAQGGASNLSESSILDLINYHSLPQTYSSSNLSVAGGVVANTALVDLAFANLQGAPNVVFASAFGSTGQDSAASGLQIYSGAGAAANVTQPDLTFDGGVVHVIDHVLNFPQSCTQTAQTASLSTLLQAITQANLTSVVDTTAKFTCFAPTDEAFHNAGINVSALSADQLANALKYHSIVGDVGYSTALEDGQQYQTLLGVPVTVHKSNGQLLINNATVQLGNVITTNGVAQVIDTVLSPPANATVSGTPAGGSGSGGSESGGSGSSGGSKTSTATGTAADASGTSGSSTSSASFMVGVRAEQLFVLLVVASVPFVLV